MSVQYTPLTQFEREVIGTLTRFSAPTWNGPALPRPEGANGLEEIFDTLDKLIARGQYLIQAKDALSIEYTLNNITATAERFMLGTQQQVQQAADLRGVLTLIESFLSGSFASPAHASRIASAFTALRAGVETRLAPPAVAYASMSAGAAAGSSAPSSAPPAPSNTDADYSAFALDDPSQFSMAWTTFEDTFRKRLSAHRRVHCGHHRCGRSDPPVLAHAPQYRLAVQPSCPAEINRCHRNPLPQ
jgi:hypothetical protein